MFRASIVIPGKTSYCDLEGMAHYGENSNHVGKRFALWIREGSAKQVLYLQSDEIHSLAAVRSLVKCWHYQKLIPRGPYQYTDHQGESTEFSETVKSLRCVRFLSSSSCQRAAPASCKRPLVLAPEIGPFKRDGLRCILCKTQISYASSVAVYQIMKTPAIIEWTCERYAGIGIPVMCNMACTHRWAKAEVVSTQLLQTKLAQHMLHTAEAFESRDGGHGAYDRAGHFYPGVAFHKTCKWEPHHDQTAREAIQLAAAAEGDVSKLSAIGRRFIYTRCESRAVRSKCLQCRMSQRTMRHGESFKEYLTALHTRDFIKPFYYYVALQLQSSRREELVEGLLRSWTTGWGGGHVINNLLFEGELMCCSSQDQMKGMAKEVPVLPSLDASALFSMLLYYSPYGDEIMKRSPHKGNEDHELCAILRFFFKQCELRKANMRDYCRWYHGYDEKLRSEELSKHVGKLGARVFKRDGKCEM